MGTKTAFWEKKRLEEMNHEEWEALCDGCGWCCMHKFEDRSSGRIFFTCVSCSLLDLDECRCRSYRDRKRLVPGCLLMTVERAVAAWLPPSCAYRMLAEGLPLPWWHPLVSGSHETVHTAGFSVRGKALSEELVHPDDLQYFIFPEQRGLPLVPKQPAGRAPKA